MPPDELIRICLRMARLKNENKDFLTYLVHDADDPVFYAESLKPSIGELLEQGAPNKHHYSRLLRKTNRIINRYARFTGNKQGELELIMHQLSCYHQAFRFELRSAVSSRLLFKSIRKADTLILKLHEELRADYLPVFSDLVETSFNRLGKEYFDGKELASLK